MDIGKVSVIIPVFNRESTIVNAIYSVLQQTYNNIEVIVVDDCSSDNTASKIKNIKDNRLIYERLKKNSGACVARNRGIELATGYYIAFQDSDDYWHPNKLEKQIHDITCYNADIGFCAYKKNNDIFPKMKKGIYSFEQLTCNSLASTQTIIAKRKVLEMCKFDPDMPRLQDFDWMIRASANYTVCFTPEALVDVYVQENSISKDNTKLLIALNMIIEKYSNIVTSNAITSWLNLLAAEYARKGVCKPDIYKEMLRHRKDIDTYIKYLLSIFGLIPFYYKWKDIK